MLKYANKITDAVNVTYDQSLRRYFIRIYQLIGINLLITAMSAQNVFKPVYTQFFFRIEEGHILGIDGTGWVFIMGTVVIPIHFFTHYKKMSTVNIFLTSLAYSHFVGVSCSLLGYTYGGVYLVKTILICASMFGIMSIYGYSTNKDLSEFSSMMKTGLTGVVIASLVNIITRSPAVEFAISIIAVVVFSGLICCTTQRLKNLYYENKGNSMRVEIIASLTLYMYLAGLFILINNLIGIRRC